MLLQYFVGILVIINSAKLLHALEQCQAQSLSVYGHHLANHVISTRASSGLNECIMMCADESRCKSFNFRVNDKSCDLNDADRFTHPQDYGPKHGIVYMDTSVKHRKVSLAACFDIRLFLKFVYQKVGITIAYSRHMLFPRCLSHQP